MRTFFVNRFYFPDETATAQLLTDLAEGLVAAGHEVTVIASRPPRSGLARDEHHRGVHIRRVSAPRSRAGNLIGRAFDFVFFSIAALFALTRFVRRGDVVITLTDPPLLGVWIALVARLKGAQCVHWIQDIYPEIAVEITGQRSLLWLRPLRNLGWRLARGCVAASGEMAKVVASTGVPAGRIHVSENWSPAGVQPATASEVQALRAAWGLDEKFVAMYSGNLGRAHDLVPLIDLAELLRNDPQIAIVFVGEGAQRRSLENLAHARRLENVRFFGPQPRERLHAALSVADLHFVTVRPGAERYVFPSKLYGIARVGRPALVIANPDSALAQTVRTRGFGAAFDRTEIDAAGTWARSLRSDLEARNRLGAAAEQFASDGHERAVAFWSSLLADLAVRTQSS